MAQVLFECMNKDCKNNEMVDAGEFLNLSIETLLEKNIKNSLRTATMTSMKAYCWPHKKAKCNSCHGLGIR